MKKERNSFFQESNYYSGFSQNQMPNMMMQPPFQASANSSFYAGVNPNMMPNNNYQPAYQPSNESELESRISKLERRISRIEARISKLENTTIYPSEDTEITNMYMV